MSQAARLDLVHNAISNRRIQWKDACLRRFRGDPEMQSFTQRGVTESLQDFIKRGGQLKARKESETSDWFDPDDPFWYFAVIPAAIFKWGLFVKVKLLWDEGDDEWAASVEIVSIHEEKKL